MRGRQSKVAEIAEATCTLPSVPTKKETAARVAQRTIAMIIKIAEAEFRRKTQIPIRNTSKELRKRNDAAV